LIITRDEVDEAVLRLSRAFDAVAASSSDA
jgi:hypothetical protein